MAKLKGLFVTIDGPYGVGKTSVLRGVASQLMQLGIDILETKEPTLSQLGQHVREAEQFYQGNILACLVAADRYLHLHQEVLPGLSKGKVVLSDRYVESSLVLQRFDDVDIDFIWSINSQVYIPDLTIILTASPEILEKRISKRVSLRRFERTKSRKNELKYYINAAEFLSKRGFNILLLDNSSEKSLNNNINRVVECILSLINRK